MNCDRSLLASATAERASGILLHVTSLPSRYGIGDVGPAAVAWVDRLQEAGQSWWQALPLGPTGYANSPYQAISSFAGNELVISPDWLIEDGLLKANECQPGHFPNNQTDYNAVIPFKHQLLEAAWRNFEEGARPDLRSDYRQFCGKQAHWLDDYALFRALKARYGGAYYLEWPQELVLRDPAALALARTQLADRIRLACFIQFVSFRQTDRLKRHAQERGVRLIGDLPFFVSPDSSDVWANPQFFLLDEHRRPQFVAGVPPDYFSSVGQLWGNPTYNWDALATAGYGWCINRLRALLSHVDAIRLDHFRGFAAAWHVPAGAATAQSGHWRPGPGAAFFTAARKELGSLPFLAEDLGVITPDVTALREQFQLPGMRVLQFAFDGNAGNPHLPGNYTTNTVAYTATHDNPTTRGWFGDLPDEQRRKVSKFVEQSAGAGMEVAPGMMKVAWSSAAALAIAPLQDLLNLGNEARMNVPGSTGGNWRWRSTGDMLNSPAFDWLRDLTKSSGRTTAAVLSACGQV